MKLNHVVKTDNQCTEDSGEPKNLPLPDLACAQWVTSIWARCGIPGAGLA